MARVTLLTKDKEHQSQLGLLHDVAASASYKIGATHVVCGIATTTVELVQDGSAPDVFDVSVRSGGLCKERSPVVELIGGWIKEVLEGDGLIGNVADLEARTNNTTVYYTRLLVTVYILDDDGCAFDVCLFAVVKALLALEITKIRVGVDGQCEPTDETFKLQLLTLPIPFSCVMKTNEVASAFFSFVLTQDEVIHVHLHGGNAVLSPKIFTRCVSAGRAMYQKYATVLAARA